MKIFTNNRILIVSPESWSHDFLTKHHYAVELGKLGNQVYFLNPPDQENKVSVTSFLNVSIVDYSPRFRGINHFPSFLTDLFCASDIRNIQNLAGGKFDMVWSFDPYRFQNLNLFQAQYRIYFAADLHANKKLEKRLADNSQLVLSPSQLVLDSIHTAVPKVKIDHAVADYFLARPESKPENKRVKIGYVGNLNSKYLAYDLLERVVKENSESEFFFIGENPGLTLPSNAHMLGRRKNHEVPALLQTYDAMLLCYDTERFWEEASNSHKIMEYLATGKVVISTRIAEYEDKPELLMMAEQSKLSQLVKEVCSQLAFHNSPEKQNQRVEYARQHSYRKQVEKIEHYLTAALGV